MTGARITVDLFDPVKGEDSLRRVHAAHFHSKDSAAKREPYAQWLLANPVQGSIYLAAYVDGAFASFLGLMAREVVGFGQRFRGALAFAGMTLPEYSGHGLFKRLTHAGWQEAQRRGFDFAMGYVTRPYVLDMELRTGWSKLAANPVMAFPLDVPAVARAAARRIGPLATLAAPVTPIARRLSAWLAKRVSLGPYSLVPAERFSHEYDGLTSRLEQAERLTFAKDHATLDWLYLSPHNPFQYDILEARHRGALVGFAIGRRMDLLGLDGYGILDLVAEPRCQAALAPLVAGLVTCALRARSQVIGALVTPDDPAQRALRSLGFIDSRRSFALIFRPIQEGLPGAVFEGQNWCSLWGNNDTI